MKIGVVTAALGLALILGGCGSGSDTSNNNGGASHNDGSTSNQNGNGGNPSNNGGGTSGSGGSTSNHNSNEGSASNNGGGTSNHNSNEGSTSGNSGSSSNNGSSTSNHNGGSTSDNSGGASSSWRVASTLYDRDIQKRFSIHGNECQVWQDKNGIAYKCDENLSSSGAFDYDTIAKVVTPFLYRTSTPSTKKEILIAESNVSKGDFTFYYPPIIYKGYLYGNFGGRYEKTVGNDGRSAYFNRYEVNEYNLSKFTKDTTLESLISTKIFSANRQVSPIFSPYVSSIMELNGYLYFNTFPKQGGLIDSNNDFTENGNFTFDGIAESLQDSSINFHYENHKYDIRKHKTVYVKDGHPIYKYERQEDGDNICNTMKYTNAVRITDGWMVPGSGTKIAFLNGERMTEIDACSGEDVKVFESNDHCAYSVMVDQRITDRLSPYMLSVSNAYSYFSINGDILSSTTFERQGKTIFGHSSVDKSVNVLNDFIDKYGNNKSYDYLTLQDEMVLDGDTLYLLGEMSYGSEDDDYKNLMAYNDLYLFTYSSDLKLQEATLLISSTKKTLEPLETQRFYKYKNNLYFKYDKGTSRELYSYNLKEKKINYKYHISSMYRERGRWYDYAITGETIILPQNLHSTKKGYDYDLVFTVLDLKSGTVLKTIRSDKLQFEDQFDYSLKSMGSYVYAGDVYFVFEKSYVGYGNHYVRNLLVKIPSPNNKTKVTRFRGDNRLTGVIRNAYVESALEPKNEKERLIIALYRYLNGDEESFADLNHTLVNHIAKEKSLGLQALFETPKPQPTYTEYNATSLDRNFTTIEQYDQSTPLYNTELLTNTQTFYIPLLKEVAYSSTGEDSINDLGEARLHINAQYGCQKSYFKFPYEGSYKLFGFDPINSDREFSDPIPESLSFKTDVPMLVVDYEKLFENQTLLRYGIDAAEYDSLSTLETITRTLKESLDSLVSTAGAIVMGNYASAICSTANIITTYAVNSLNAGDTYYGSAMKIYTANSNFGIDNNRSFTYDTIEGSAKSLTIDANSAGDLVENICAGVSLDPATLISFATKADYDKKHVKAKVLPTWHRGIEIKHLDINVTNIAFMHTPLLPLHPLHQAHTFNIRGRIATLGTQQPVSQNHKGFNSEYMNKNTLQPFAQQLDIHYDFIADAHKPFEGWNIHPLEATWIYAKSGIDKSDSIVGTYIEMTMYSDDMQMGIFTDTLFLDEAIFTDHFTKDGKRYSTTVTKPFYFPDGSPQMKRPVNGTVTYTVSFEVE